MEAITISNPSIYSFFYSSYGGPIIAEPNTHLASCFLPLLPAPERREWLKVHKGMLSQAVLSLSQMWCTKLFLSPLLWPMNNKKTEVFHSIFYFMGIVLSLPCTVTVWLTVKASLKMTEWNLPAENSAEFLFNKEWQFQPPYISKTKMHKSQISTERLPGWKNNNSFPPYFLLNVV